jgi:phage terminase large subunit-like protein
LDPTFLPILYEAPADANWTHRRVWRRANPALGDFRSLEEMEIAAARAKEIPAQENNFRRLYLNQWTEQASRWLALSAWDACLVPIDRAALRARRCYVGMDLSSTDDLTALVAVFPDGAGGFAVLPHFFVPGDRIADRVRRDRVPYDQWARAGHLTPVPGATIGDYVAVQQHLEAWRAEFDVAMVATDPWNATTLIYRLEQDGCPLVKVPQTFAGLSAATKSLEKHVLSRTLRQAGHPVLRWNIGNVSVETDPAGNLKPSKRASTEKIDGVVALIQAIDAMERTIQADYSVMVVG